MVEVSFTLGESYKVQISVMCVYLLPTASIFTTYVLRHLLFNFLFLSALSFRQNPMAGHSTVAQILR